MTPSRWLRTAVLAIALLFALSGCVKLDMDMNVRADNTVDGTLIVAVDKELLRATGQTEADFLKQVETQGPFSAKDRPKHGSFSQRPYNAGGKIGQAYTFTGVPLSEFGGGADGLSIIRRGDRFFVTGVVDMTTDTPTDPQEKAIAERFKKTAETRIRMTFPGEVLKSNGKIDGRSVTWHPKIGEKTTLTAEARTSAIIPILLAAVGAAAVLLLVVGLVVFLLLRRRRRAAFAGAYPGAGYEAGGYAGDVYPPAYPQPGVYPPAYPPPAYPQPGSQSSAYPPADATQPLPQVDPPPPAPGRPYGN